MSANDIRKTLLILETTATPVAAPVEEAAPMGFFKSLATTAGAMFSDVKLGELKVGDAANKLYAQYLQYLGKIGKKPGTEDVGDLFDFMVKEGHPVPTIFAGISRGLSIPVTDKAGLQKFWNSVIQKDYKNRIGKVFLNTIQAATKLPEKDLDPESFAKRSQAGASISTSIEKGAKPTAAPATKEPESAPPPPTTPVANNTKDIDDALAQLGAA